MIKNLRNKIKTSPRAGEVDTKCRVRGTREQTVGIYLRLFSTALNVMLACERSELPRASRNIMALLSKETNSIVSRFFNVINGLVPLILVQRMTNQVKKLAILFKRSLLNQDCRNASGNDSKRRRLSVCCKFINTPHSALLRHPLPQGAREQGRSMIEMLGVLAIIAVLSVGGIAGYSKAMQMWRSNIQKQMIEEIISAAIKIKPNLNPKSTNWENLTPVLYAMGDIPAGTNYENERITTKDGIRATLYYGLWTWDRVDGTKGQQFRMVMAVSYRVMTGYSFSPSGKDFCRNLITASNQIPEVNNAIMWVKDSEATNADKTTGIRLYDKSKDKNISLAEITQRCNQVIKEDTYANIWVDLQPY